MKKLTDSRGLLLIYGRKQIIFTAFWSKVLDFFYNWYIDSVCEDKALHQV